MQIVQAQAVMDQIAFFRRGSGMPERQLGSLFWQLNDLWYAPISFCYMVRSLIKPQGRSFLG